MAKKNAEAEAAPEAEVTVTLTPALIASINAHRAGQSTASDVTAVWQALYLAAPPPEPPKPRVIGK